MGQLKKLTMLNLANNALTGNIPEEWTGLESLQSLWIVNNRLTGDLSENVFAWLNKFQYNIDQQQGYGLNY